MGKRVAVIAAHPDDEALGCGGTIAKHVISGDSVHVVFMADGVTSRVGNTDSALSARHYAATAALHALGAASMESLGLPDNRMDSIPLLKIVQKLEAALSGYHPQIIYTHHAGDLNVDHRMCCQAVMTACRPTPGSVVKDIYSFEVLSSTEWAAPPDNTFRPNHFVDITQTIDQKIAALKAYEEEMRPTPHSRSVQHARVLAEHRGYSVGLGYAEAFMTLRSIA